MPIEIHPSLYMHPGKWLMSEVVPLKPGFALLPKSRFGVQGTAYISESRPRAVNYRFVSLAELYSMVLG